MPASSAPQRSQYHSVGRLSVPHSPHLSVLATPAAPALPGAALCPVVDGASVVRVAALPDAPGLLCRLDWAPAGAGFRSSSGATDLRKASSSPGGVPWVI